MKKNISGFTLIELLAVIIILSLLIILVLPSITNSVRNYGSQTDELMFSMIESAVKLYVEDNNSLYPKKNGNSYCIELNELVDKEYLNSPIKYGDVDITDTKSVKVTYNDGFDYELVDIYSCVEYNNICTAVTEETVTTGNIPSGNYAIGDEYICEVKEGIKYRFFVLSTEGDTVNLILDRNICVDGTLTEEGKTCLVAWNTSGSNLDGPVTAMDYLYNATKDWTNIPNIEMNYTDEENQGNYGYGTIKTTDNITKITKKDGTAVKVLTDQDGYSNLKARMPYKSEVSDYDSSNKTNAYLYNYLELYNNIQTNVISEISGYWILSSSNDASIFASDVYYNGNVHNIDNVDNSSLIGIRPVINLKF